MSGTLPVFTDDADDVCDIVLVMCGDDVSHITLHDDDVYHITLVMRGDVCHVACIH